jgi:uncharacterized DUF497 family protein
MSDFDPGKEAVNLAKHRISLARWVHLEDFTIVPDDRFDYGEPRYRAYGYIDGAAYCLVFTIRMSDTGRSVFDAHMQRK